MAWSAFFPNNIFTFSPTQQASRLVSNYNIIRLIRIFKLKKKKERKKKRINGLFCCSCLLFFFFSLCLLVIVLSQVKISMIKKRGRIDAVTRPLMLKEGTRTVPPTSGGGVEQWVFKFGHLCEMMISRS